jgi:membrane protease YdiL (CAAX protease family)
LQVQTLQLKPLGFGKSLLYFGIPAILINLTFWVVMRVLDVLAFRLFVTFLLGFGVPSLLLFLLSLWLFRRDGFPLRRESFIERFRLQKPDLKTWLWTAILCGLWIAGLILLQPVTEWLQLNWISPPKLWIRIMASDPDYIMEFPKNNILVPLGFGSLILANLLGGEFFWRGYVFPRQELAFGSSTWIVHGSLWALFRLFMIWDIAFILFSSFILSYVVQRTKSTWPALIAHLLMFVRLAVL